MNSKAFKDRDEEIIDLIALNFGLVRCAVGEQWHFECTDLRYRNLKRKLMKRKNVKYRHMNIIRILSILMLVTACQSTKEESRQEENSTQQEIGQDKGDIEEQENPITEVGIESEEDHWEKETEAESYGDISYLDGQFYQNSSLPRDDNCKQMVITDSTKAVKIDLKNVNDEQFQRLRTFYDIMEIDSVGRYFTVKEDLFENEPDSLLYNWLFNKEIETYQMASRLSYFRVLYDYKFNESLATTYDQMRFMIRNMSRDKEQILQMFNRYEQLLYCLIPEKLYNESGMHLYVRTLLRTYQQLHGHIVDYSLLMLQFHEASQKMERQGLRAEREVYQVYEPYIDESIVEKFEATQVYLDSKMSRTVLWFYSFWSRRYQEGNDEVVYEILQRINSHYTDRSFSEPEYMSKETIRQKIGDYRIRLFYSYEGETEYGEDPEYQRQNGKSTEFCFDTAHPHHMIIEGDIDELIVRLVNGNSVTWSRYVGDLRGSVRIDNLPSAYSGGYQLLSNGKVFFQNTLSGISCR